VLNPQLLDHILEETPGIVLIDEVDMHLHPEWQRRIMEDLHYIFPKIQFIVTTHSPSVLANVKREHIILLEKNQVYVPDNTTYGRDITAILHEVMKVEIRPQQVIDLKDRFYKSLSDEQYEQAKKLLKELEDVLGNNDADVLQAKVSLDLELL
jgi:predicted ATP-binding protein involved in virulence